MQMALCLWRDRWGLDKEDVSATCLRASELEPGAGVDWRVRAARGEAFAWYRRDAAIEAGVAKRLFGPAIVDESESIALQVARRACDDLVATLLSPTRDSGPVTDEAGQPPATLQAIGSGAIHASIDVQGARVECLLAPEADGTVLESGKGAAIEAPDAAVLHACITVQAEIGSAEVSMSEFRALSVGDVICFGHRVDEPLRVTGPDGRALFCGHLGVRDGALALDVLPEIR